METENPYHTAQWLHSRGLYQCALTIAIDSLALDLLLEDTCINPIYGISAANGRV